MHDCGRDEPPVSPYVAEESSNGYRSVPLITDCELSTRLSTDVEEVEHNFDPRASGDTSRGCATYRQISTTSNPKRGWSKESQATPDMTSVVSRMIGIARNVLRALWLLSFIWAVLKAFSRRGFKNNKAVLHLSGPRLAHSELMETNWPSPYFSPHALVCPRADVAFFADKFRVFRLDQNHEVTTYPCDVNGTIADISADCDEKDCWPMVLLTTNPPSVLDCSTGKEYPLLQTEQPAQQFAVVNAYTLVAAHQGQIVQYSWNAPRKGWAPNWIISDIGREALQALDVTDDSERILIFRRGGIVQLQDLKTGRLCGVWEASSAMLGAGCSEASGKILKLLVRINDPELGPQVRLMRSTLDGPQNCVEVNPDSVAAVAGKQRGTQATHNRWFE